MPRKPKVDPVAAAWERIEALPGASKSLAPPADDLEQLDNSFEYVFEFSLPDAVRDSYLRHDGERGKGAVCAPLRLVSAEEALAFAAALVGQTEGGADVKAHQRLAKKLAASMEKQGLQCTSEAAARWTLALGKGGHRIAVDCEAEWVVEERPDGSVVKLADDYETWLARLAGADVKPAPTKAAKPIDKSHAKLLATYGAATTYRSVDAKLGAKLAKLHPWFGKLVGRDGLAAYGGGLWTCDPGDFVELAQLWKTRGRWLERFEWNAATGKTRAGLDAHVFARSAFGHVLLLTKADGVYLGDPETRAARSIGIVDRSGAASMQSVFDAVSDRALVQFATVKELRDASAKHGALAWNEAYFWNAKKGHHAACQKVDLVEGTRSALGVSK